MDANVASKGLISVALVAMAASCAVDDRQLSALSSASASSSGGMNELGGSAGDDGGGPAPLPTCDFGAGVPDGCDTLVENPGFEHDSAGWKAEDSTVAMSWNKDDAAKNAHSGSLSVVNTLYGVADGIASRGAAQCLPALAGQGYGFALDVFIPKGQGEGLDGGSYRASAGLSVIFYTSKHCDQFTLGSATSELLQDEGEWAHREGHALAPKGAESMAVRLTTLKNFQEYSFEARFDNVLMRAE